jgi:hypothetical protein
MTDYSKIKLNRIAYARDELLGIADELENDEFADRIRDVVDGLMHRIITKPRVARATAVRINAEVVAFVLELITRNPNKSNRWIGRKAGIDGGRVSEIQAGHRTIDNPTMRQKK